MDKHGLIAILERARLGTLTSADVDALHVLLRPYLAPEAFDDRERRELPSPRAGAVATVDIDYVRDRYNRGEFRIQTSYRLPDGSLSTDENHRIRFTGQLASMVRALWEVGFDETSRALQNEPAVLRLNVGCQALEAFWSEIVRSVAIIIGHELKVTVTGTAPAPPSPASTSPAHPRGDARAWVTRRRRR
jgi:hypothetical protein